MRLRRFRLDSVEKSLIFVVIFILAARTIVISSSLIARWHQSKCGTGLTAAIGAIVSTICALTIGMSLCVGSPTQGLAAAIWPRICSLLLWERSWSVMRAHSRLHSIA